MEINNIKPEYVVTYCTSAIDAEERAIMRRLLSYGVTPTGNKTKDKELLHRIEIEEAKRNNYVCGKFLTVSKNEQEKIQEKKKDKKKEQNPEKYPNSQKGAKILGEQIYLAIKMKKNQVEN